MANAAFNMKLLSSISAFERDCQVFYDDDDDDDGADYDSNFPNSKSCSYSYSSSYY